jgi:uncharacterized protein YqjF (DUF2071 family)
LHQKRQYTANSPRKASSSASETTVNGSDEPVGIFLTAEWRYLAMLNYAVDPQVLLPRVPAGTELDFFDGQTFVSLVGFRFLNTRVRGIPVPFHRDFDEVNLRFYVKRREDPRLKRGVVFIQEIVPRRAISLVARIVYNENYRRLPMRHEIAPAVAGLSVQYEWRLQSLWNRLTVHGKGEPREIVHGSAEQFIAEHYWGYCAHPRGGSLEYQVEHPPWKIWEMERAEFAGDAKALYGAELGKILNQQPDSAFLAEGSAVAVHTARRLAYSGA